MIGEKSATAKTMDMASFLLDEAATSILKQIIELGLSREDLEEDADFSYPVVTGRCQVCSKDDWACRLLHGGIVCDNCFTAVRDSFTALAECDFDRLAQSMQRFFVQSEMKSLRAVN